MTYWIIPVVLGLALAWWAGYRAGARTGYRDAERDRAVPIPPEEIDAIGREVVADAVPTGSSADPRCAFIDPVWGGRCQYEAGHPPWRHESALYLPGALSEAEVELLRVAREEPTAGRLLAAAERLEDDQ